MRNEVQMFFQDVVDRVECKTCGAAKGELCVWDEPPARPQTAILSHPARLAAHRASMSNEEFAALGTDMLRRFKALEEERGSA